MTFPVARAGPIFQHSIKTVNVGASEQVFDSMREQAREGRTRKVPGDDLTNDTDRLMEGVDELVFAGLNGLAVDLVGPTSVISEGADGEGHVRVLGPQEGFA